MPKKALGMALVCYLDNKRKAIVSAFCIVANCPPPEIVMKRRQQGTRNLPNNPQYAPRIV